MTIDNVKKLKQSELLAIWEDFGMSPDNQSRCLPAINLREHGDCLTSTTEESIKASIRCELDGDTYSPPSVPCESCSGGIDNCDKYWVEGHRQGWWVCSQCKWVFPCRHEDIDDLNEVGLTGTCSTCGMRMPHSLVANYLHKRYAAQAEHFRMNAESLREQETSQRGWEKSRDESCSGESFSVFISDDWEI